MKNVHLLSRDFVKLGAWALPADGPLPIRQSFVTLQPEGVHLSSLRTKPHSQLEMTLVEVEGHETTATVSLNLPMKNVG